MRRSPSIVPPGNDQDVYLVLDDFGGRIGQAWRETDVESARLETVIADLLDRQYSNPVRVIAFNTAEGWSRDVSEDVAHELRRFCAEMGAICLPFFRSSLNGKRGERGSGGVLVTNKDQELIFKALAEMQQIAVEYSDPCYPESADLTLQRIIEILNRQDLVAAAERLSKGYGLRVVK